MECKKCGKQMKRVEELGTMMDRDEDDCFDRYECQYCGNVVYDYE